jgi:hypothetical protein
VTRDVEAFLNALRSRPKFLEAAKSKPKPKLYGDLVRLQFGLQALYRASATNKHKRGLFDEIRTVVARQEQPIQVRLLEIMKILEKARSRRQ